MNWKNIRLELARTESYPDGSASRVYLLRLPLLESGLIDEAAFRESPMRATVRRHWPNQADMSGYVVRTDKGWALSYLDHEELTGPAFDFDSHAMRKGELITVTEPDGGQLPFRITDVQ